MTNKDENHINQLNVNASENHSIDPSLNKNAESFPAQFMNNFHQLISQVQDAGHLLDTDTIKQAKLLFHNLKSKLHEPNHLQLIKSIPLMTIKLAYRNHRINDVVLFYSNKLYRTSRITNPLGLSQLIENIDSEQNNIAVKGKLFELIYATLYAQKGCLVQFGSVDGIGGDVVVFNANEFGVQHKTVQLKYITGLSDKKFKDHCRTAADQLGLTRKGRQKEDELPQKGHLREMVLLIEHHDHPVTRESKTKLGQRLQSIFEFTPKAANVDIVTIKTVKTVYQYKLKDIL